MVKHFKPYRTRCDFYPGPAKICVLILVCFSSAIKYRYFFPTGYMQLCSILWQFVPNTVCQTYESLGLTLQLHRSKIF